MQTLEQDPLIQRSACHACRYIGLSWVCKTDSALPGGGWPEGVPEATHGPGLAPPGAKAPERRHLVVAAARLLRCRLLARPLPDTSQHHTSDAGPQHIQDTQFHTSIPLALSTHLPVVEAPYYSMHGRCMQRASLAWPKRHHSLTSHICDCAHPALIMRDVRTAGQKAVNSEEDRGIGSHCSPREVSLKRLASAL